MKLNDIGERSIIKKLALDNENDDCYIMEFNGSYILLSTDIITGKTHIPDGADPELAGKFFATINLSDIAAMAGIPEGFLISLSISPEYDIKYLEKFYSGIKKELKKFNAKIIGGDTKEGDDFTASGTIIGKQDYNVIRKRSYIKGNQYLMVTGLHGSSGSGYIFYKYHYDKSYGIKKMLDIEPRINEAIIISKAGAQFMMDLSDGIYASVYQMKNDYNIGFKIYMDKVKMDNDVYKASEISGFPIEDIALSFGGDYELMFTINKNSYDSFMELMYRNKINAYCIGETYNGDNVIYRNGSWEIIKKHGFEHFHKYPLNK